MVKRDILDDITGNLTYRILMNEWAKAERVEDRARDEWRIASEVVQERWRERREEERRMRREKRMECQDGGAGDEA